jgi:diaminohydroxyphosphoribosylaminopyrimidine deaminase / 5-amino-6-(5-phosphoribosylamino)uracil reductase
MPQPHVILTSAGSLDCRMDAERPDLLSNRLEEYRIQELRAKVDAILTSAERIMQEDLGFPLKDPRGPEPTIVIVDKDVSVPPTAMVFKNRSRKVILVTCKKAHPNKIKRLQDARPDLAVMEFGEYAVNLEDMLWDLHRAGIHNLILEGDDSLNMQMLNHGLVDEMYFLVAPMLLGEPNVNMFAGKLERRMNLRLEGILQYGDHVVLHYDVVKQRR